ncbi:MAG: DUF5916 domain-containing protein [Longimicrobiales bacterium]
MKPNRSIVLLCGLLLPSLARAQSPAAEHDAPVAQATRVTAPIVIDGVLDEAVWQQGAPITTFRQLDPEEGAPVSQPTEVRILFDESALYVAARLSGPVRYRLGRRDMQLLDSDWFGVVFDSYHDHRTAFRFQVNPGGVQRDATISMAGGNIADDDSWDAVWEIGTARDAEGWTAELRIPFSQLRFTAAAEQTWGLQLERIIGSRQEYALFSFTPKSEPSGVPRYGHLTGLTGIEPGERVELLPYVVARGEYVDPGPNPFRTDREHALSAGADLLYRMTSNLTLNATINPDFGQVEVDPAVVNLGVYETFFPEKRPFFVEGSEIFRFTGNTSGGDLFYSRRIGRRPQLAPPTSRADVPEVTNIMAAAKLSGKTADGWSIGLLEAVTAPEDATFLDPDGVQREMAVEPLANYFVGRVRRDMRGGRSAVGGVLTSVVRNLDAAVLENQLRSSGWAGGMDFRHEWAERSWSVQGSVAASHVRGSTDAITRTQRLSHHFFQRPDAAHLRVDTTATSLTGYSVGSALSKQAGEHWTGSVAAALTAPEFEVNDLGFQTRTDRRDLAANIRYSENRPGDFFRNWSAGSFSRYESSFDGDRIQAFSHFELAFRHLDFWGGGVVAGLNLRSLDDRSTRGGPIMIRPANRIAGIFLNSDSRKPITLRGGFFVFADEYDGGAWESNLQVAVRTSPRWQLTVGPYFSRGTIPAQYLATLPDSLATRTFGRRYVFAPLDFTHLNMNVRLNVTFAPRLTLETYLQPLIFSSDYGEPGALVAPRTFEFEPIAQPLPPLDNTFRSLRGNAVLRWEWRPGSTLYLAWQQTRVGIGESGDFDVADDPRELFRTAPDNIFLVKASYWLNL